jgi:hypothetical protein
MSERTWCGRKGLQSLSLSLLNWIIDDAAQMSRTAAKSWGCTDVVVSLRAPVAKKYVTVRVDETNCLSSAVTWTCPAIAAIFDMSELLSSFVL